MVTIVPRSRLSRLYMYSKDTAFMAQENFTTEALAIAISEDASPIVDALRELDGKQLGSIGLGDGKRPASEIRVVTQVSLPRTGWLDLVLNVSTEFGVTVGEVWIEVKIGAEESGSQLEAYLRCARAAKHRVWVITLAPGPLRSDVPNLTWYNLYRAARHRRLSNSHWADLLTFLEEQNVANDALGPISDIEAGSLDAAYRLAQKVAAVVERVRAELPTWLGDHTGKRLQWKSGGAMLNNLALNFRTTGELWTQSNALRYGLVAREGAAYWTIAIQLDERHRTVQDLVRSKIAEADSLKDWDRPLRGPQILITGARAAGFDSHEAAVGWFEARLRELSDSGLLEVLLGRSSDLSGDEAMTEEAEQVMTDAGRELGRT